MYTSLKKRRPLSLYETARYHVIGRFKITPLQDILSCKLFSNHFLSIRQNFILTSLLFLPPISACARVIWQRNRCPVENSNPPPAVAFYDTSEVFLLFFLQLAEIRKVERFSRRTFKVVCCAGWITLLLIQFLRGFDPPRTSTYSPRRRLRYFESISSGVE